MASTGTTFLYIHVYDMMFGKGESDAALFRLLASRSAQLTREELRGYVEAWKRVAGRSSVGFCRWRITFEITIWILPIFTLVK
jgi:hypothetical protein